MIKTVSLAPFASGLSNGWASPYLAQLKSNNSNYPFQLTDSETSWVASLFFLGRSVGSFTSAAIQSKLCIFIYIKLFIDYCFIFYR